MSIDKKGDLKITGWSINVKWSNGTEENIIDIPDDVADSIDEYLTEVENDKDDLLAKKIDAQYYQENKK
jgi:hypothetical protein